jgi:hypothetical protein
MWPLGGGRRVASTATSVTSRKEVGGVAGVGMVPRPGEVVVVGPSASVQFAGRQGFRFRVIQVDSRPTYDGWIWLDGYQLDVSGQAIARRKIFVRRSGLIRLALHA